MGVSPMLVSFSFRAIFHWTMIMEEKVFQICFIYTSTWGFMIQFDDHIFQLGWFNHQPTNDLRFVMPVQLAPWAIVQKRPRNANLPATFPKPLLGPALCVTWIDPKILGSHGSGIGWMVKVSRFYTSQVMQDFWTINSMFTIEGLSCVCIFESSHTATELIVRKIATYYNRNTHICIGMFLSMFISQGCSMAFSKEDLRTAQLLKI